MYLGHENDLENKFSVENYFLGIASFWNFHSRFRPTYMLPKLSCFRISIMPDFKSLSAGGIMCNANSKV